MTYLARGRRMAILGMILGLIGGRVEAHIVALDIDLPLDRVGAGRAFQVGDHHRARIFYDDAKIDARTHRVRVLHMQHSIGGKYLPARADPVFMPVSDSWLDLSAEPYALHFNASVVHGKPILIEADEHSHRLTIHPQEHPGEVLISGRYQIDSRPISGPEADAAATAENVAPAAAKSAP